MPELSTGFSGRSDQEPSPEVERQEAGKCCLLSLLRTPTPPREARQSSYTDCPGLPRAVCGSMRALQFCVAVLARVNFRKGHTRLLGASRALGPVGLSLSLRLARSKSRRVGGGTGRGASSPLAKEGKAGSTGKLFLRRPAAATAKSATSLPTPPPVPGGKLGSRVSSMGVGCCQLEKPSLSEAP